MVSESNFRMHRYISVATEITPHSCPPKHNVCGNDNAQMASYFLWSNSWRTFVGKNTVVCQVIWPQKLFCHFEQLKASQRNYRILVSDLTQYSWLVFYCSWTGNVYSHNWNWICTSQSMHAGPNLHGGKLTTSIAAPSPLPRPLAAFRGHEHFEYTRHQTQNRATFQTRSNIDHADISQLHGMSCFFWLVVGAAALESSTAQGGSQPARQPASSLWNESLAHSEDESDLEKTQRDTTGCVTHIPPIFTDI